MDGHRSGEEPPHTPADPFRVQMCPFSTLVMTFFSPAGSNGGETSPDELVHPRPRLAQEALPTEAGPGPSRWDRAVTRLMALQQEQLEELRWTIEKLAEATSRRDALVMDRNIFSPPMEAPDPNAFSMKSMLQREFSETAREVNKSEVKKQFWTTLGNFPVQEKVESQLEGPGLSPQSWLEEPGLQQRTNARGEDLRLQDSVQMDANVFQAERQPEQKSCWLQGPSTSHQVLKGFQEEPNVQEVKDLQSTGAQEKKHLETLSRKGEGNQKLVSPGHLEFSPKQNEHQSDPEVLSLPKEVSHEPQKIPELSDKKECEATSKGEIDGLQTTSKQQEILDCTGSLWKKEKISQPWKPCGHQGVNDLEISQALLTPDMDQTLPEKRECNIQEGSSQEGPFHGLNVNNLHPQREILKRSKSLGCLEVIQKNLFFQASRDSERSLQLLSEKPQRAPSPKTQMENVHSQQSSLQNVLQSKTDVIQTDTKMKVITSKPHVSLQGKQEPQKEMDSQDGRDEKTFHTQGTQMPPLQDWEELDPISNLHGGSPTLHIGEMKRSSEDVCHQEQKVLLEFSHCQGSPLKKSNSPEPQELLQTRANESKSSLEISLDNRYPQDPQHQEWEKMKTQDISEREVLKLPDSVEVLQHPSIPKCQEEVLQIPGPLSRMSETSTVEEKLDFQKQEVPSKEVRLSRPQAQNQMDTDPVLAQKLQTGLSRSEFQIGLARNTKSLQLEESSRVQDVGQSEELHSSGATEGIGREILRSQKAQLEWPVLTLRESLALQPQKLASERQEGLSVSQDFRSSESPPLLWSVLWQKAKSFEQAKPCLLLGPQLGQAAIQRTTTKELPILRLPQEMKAVLLVQREEGSLVEMEHQKLQKSNILSLQDVNYQEVMLQTQTEKVVLVEKCTQTDSQEFQHRGETTSEVLLEMTVGQVNLGEIRPGETGELETPSSHEAPQSRLQKLQGEKISQRELELLKHSGSFLQEDLTGTQPPTKESLGEVQIQEEVLQKERFVPQHQEHRSLDSPPLLWGVVGLKSKSFELRTSCDREAQELKESPGWRRSNVERESSTQQTCRDLDVIPPQDLQEVGSPSVESKRGTFQTGRILPRYSQLSQSPQINNSEIPQSQEAGPRTIVSPFLSDREALMDQEIREMGSSQTWITSQEKPDSSETLKQVVELIKNPELATQELEDQRNSLPSKTKSLETLLHPEKSRSFEPSPVLGRASEIKAKSLELLKSQALRMSCSEATPSRSQQDLQACHVEEGSQLEMVPPSERLQMEQEFQEIQNYGIPQVYLPRDLGEQAITQIQVGKSVYTQILDSIPMPHLLGESKEVQTLELQELRNLEPPQAQSDKILEELEKPENVRPHGKNIGALTSQPGPEGKAECLQHAKRSSPETPPLLWWVLELAHHRILHNVSPQPQESSSYVPGMQRQEGPQTESEAQHPRNQTVPLAKKLQKLEAPQPQKAFFQVEGSRKTDGHLQSQECIDPEPSQPHEIVPQVESISPALSVSDAFQFLTQEKAKSSQGPERSPQDFEVHLLKERELVTLEESSKGDVHGREGSPVMQKHLIPRKPKDLECLVQEDRSKLGDSCKGIHSHVHQAPITLGNLDSLDPSSPSVQLQRLKTDAEHCGLLNGSQVLHSKEPANGETLKGVKQEDSPILEASEEHSKIKVVLSLEKPLEKSKSFDLGELQILKIQEPPKKESFQSPTTEVLKVQEDLPEKHQKEIDSLTISSQEKSQQVTPQLLQSYESASESPSLQSSSTQTLELPEMDPYSLQAQELGETLMLQPQRSKLQKTMNSKTLCLQGHHEAENCELGVEDSHLEMRGILQRSPQSFLIQDIFYPLADMFRKSKSLELPKANVVLLQGLRRPDIAQSQENVKECPQILDSQTSSQGMNTSLQEKEGRCSTQKELKESQSQEKLGQNKPATINPEDDQVQQLQRKEGTEVLHSPGIPQRMEPISLQMQGNLQNNPEYFGCRGLSHPDVLQTDKHSVISETIELEKQVESITQVSLMSTEKGALSVWWTLGKSKSLDLRELQACSSQSLLGELDCSNPREMPSANLSQPQRDLQDEQWKCRTPLDYSKTQPLEDLISKDKIVQQEENPCASQKTEHVELETQNSEELLKLETEIMTFQKMEDIQMFCSKKYRELEAPQLQVIISQSLKEPLCTDQHVQTESRSPGLRNLQSPPLLRNLLRKSKTFGYEEQISRLAPQIQDVQKEEDSLHVERRSEESTPQKIQEMSKPEILQHQEIENVESIGESTGQPNCPRETQKMEMDSTKSQISLQTNQEPLQEQRDALNIVPQDNIPKIVPPCDIPQFGIKFLQELGRLHNELNTLRPPQELKDGKAICPHAAKGSSQSQQQILAEPQINIGSQVLEHQKWSAATSPQPPPPGDFSEASKMQQQSLQSPQSQGLDQILGVKRESARNMESPMQKAPSMVQRQEDLSTKSVVVPVATDPPFLQSLEKREAKTLDLQESLNLEGKVREKQPMVTEPQEDHLSNKQEPVMTKSKSLDPQSLSRTPAFQHERAKTVEGLPSLDKERATEHRPISRGPLNIQAEATSSQSQEFPTKQEKLPQDQKAEMTQQVDQHFHEQHGMLKLQEGRNLKSWKDQELGPLQLQGMEENQLFQEWREAGTLPAEGTQPRQLLTCEKGLLNLAGLEREDENKRLEGLWEQKTTETRAMTLLSPSSSGKSIEMMWEPSSFNMGISRETSFDVAHPPSPSWLLPPPRPPSREKAFIWLTPQARSEALQRLAEARAKGERRHQRDKERQTLRFQERLSIAKRRRSKEDLLGDGPADRGPWASPTSEGQDEAGQKMAVRSHLEKVKRERTYIMQSKRERNTLKFKELLDPLVAPREEKLTLRQAEELQQRANFGPLGSPEDQVKMEALSHISHRIPKE
ncbi:uncharacterized protein LOC120319329 [Crotalus tigris]|uniref:uncharacterized protein LOC120319329 n=1 Tax=Crotalus tigris TaxID=88082 RepID=UPI00192F2250|nr:uncharacterized protein LOC120319329 [Crotalus tigris]